MSIPTHVENGQRIRALEQVLFPKCPRCHETMTPLSMRTQRLAGGEAQVTLWECPADLILYESQTSLRVVYNIKEMDAPAVVYNASETIKKDLKERMMMGVTLDERAVNIVENIAG